jgi:CubicO group peptidase (beta-lactamase class C family)
MRSSHLIPLVLFAVLALPVPGARAGEDEVVSGNLGRKLDQAVWKAARGDFWGAVLVAQKGEILLAKGYGEADYAERPNTANTLFEIASASKQFTAAAVLRLQQDGKLKVTDSIAKHLRGVPADKRGITIHHLLTHTSGIPGDAGVPYASKMSRKQYVRHVLEPALVSKPGETFAYNNAAYALLAAIVEEVANTTFEKYSKKKLFGPAGLKDTGFVRDRTLDEVRQTVRRGDRMPEATAIDWHWGWGYRGMGGVISTVHDLYRWDRALLGEDVLDAGTKALLFEPVLEQYACGWRVEATDRGTRKIHHSGGVHGYACQIARYPEDDAVIVVLSNGKSDLHAVERALGDLLFPKPVLRATLNVGDFAPDERKIAELPGTLAWAARKDGAGVTVRLEDTASGKTAATLHLPVGPAKKLLSDLDGALRGREDDDDASVEAGMYLQPYTLAGDTLEITDGLSLMLRSKYVGRGEGGKTVVDERITFSLVDSLRHQWPLMVKMGPAAARALRDGLRAALDG